MQRLIAALCLALTAACGDTPTSPAPVDAEVTLAPGQRTLVIPASVAITFREVADDSRCPINALCPLPGSATVRIQIQGPGRTVQDYELRAGGLPLPQPIRHGDLTIELLSLTPHPFAGHPFDPSEYRATLRVTRSVGS